MLLDQPGEHPRGGVSLLGGSDQSARSISSIATTNGSIFRDCHLRRAGSGGIADINACRTVRR